MPILISSIKFITNLLSTFSNFSFTLNCSNQSKLFSLSLVFNLSFLNLIYWTHTKSKKHIERSFADSKQNHGYRYTMYKGVKKSTLNMPYLFCSKHEKYSKKNDNVGKEPIILSSYNSNTI